MTESYINMFSLWKGAYKKIRGFSSAIKLYIMQHTEDREHTEHNGTLIPIKRQLVQLVSVLSVTILCTGQKIFIYIVYRITIAFHFQLIFQVCHH